MPDETYLNPLPSDLQADELDEISGSSQHALPSRQFCVFRAGRERFWGRSRFCGRAACGRSDCTCGRAAGAGRPANSPLGLAAAAGAGRPANWPPGRSLPGAGRLNVFGAGRLTLPGRAKVALSRVTAGRKLFGTPGPGRSNTPRLYPPKWPLLYTVLLFEI